MRRLIIRWVTLSVAFLLVKPSAAQDDDQYSVNGSAYRNNCNCYTLTPDANFMSGSIWNKHKIDLTKTFNYNFNIFLGSNDFTGADGIAFVLQPVSTSIGSSGEGLGYEGIFPSIGIAIDTYQNVEKGDPEEDNITIHKNGIMVHSKADDVAGPVPALTNTENIEDGAWHFFRIVWEADTKDLIAEIDGVRRVKAHIDLVADIFNNDPMVYWGFTAATGGSTNLQKVCTSLNPAFFTKPGQKTCYPEPIQFYDTSRSFGSIIKWSWDFGDGTTYDFSTPPPHLFPSPGKYDVRFAFVGNNGCVSDTVVKTVIIGSKPVANFTYQPDVICEEAPVKLIESAHVEFGSIDNWIWNVGSSQYNVQKPQNVLLRGTNKIELTVSTIEGCVSDPFEQVISTKPSPVIDFGFTDVCSNEIPSFQARDIDRHSNIIKWNWDFGDGSKTETTKLKLEHKYNKSGVYPVVATAVGENGCASAPVSKSINIYETNAFAGNDMVVARNQPVQLNGSGGDFYQWSPGTGLNDQNISNPVAILQHDAHYVLKVSSTVGCSTFDTLNIKVYDGPDLYVPSAFSPNDDGLNDTFKFLAVGMSSVDLFQVFNRYGQQVYSSPDATKGWDGRVKGVVQPGGAYIWMIKGVDYNGKVHQKKGTVVLIR